MILRNITFENDLPIIEDHVSTILVESPECFARIAQSFCALNEGEVSPEPFIFLEDERQLDPEKLMMLISDPFHIDINNKKNLNLLFGELSKKLAANVERQTEWEKYMIQAGELVEQLVRDMSIDIYTGNIMSFSTYLKETGVRFELPKAAGFQDRIYDVMKMIAEFMPQKLLVLCNIAAYCSSDTWYELMKMACYLKVKILDIEQSLPENLYTHEIRWVIHPDYDDEILKA